MSGQHHQGHHQTQPQRRGQTVFALDGHIEQQESPRQPGDDIELVDMLYLGPDKAPQRENDCRRQRTGPAQVQGTARKRQRPPSRQDNVQDNRGHHLLGGGEPQKQPVEWIEKRRLHIGEKRCTHKKMRIPQWEVTSTQSLGHIRFVGIKIEKRIHTHQNEIGEDYLPEKYEDQRRNQQPSAKGAQTRVCHGDSSMR